MHVPVHHRILLLLCSPLDELKRLLDRCSQVNAVLDKADQASASSSMQSGGQLRSEGAQRGAGADLQGSQLPAASGRLFAISLSKMSRASDAGPGQSASQG